MCKKTISEFKDYIDWKSFGLSSNLSYDEPDIWTAEWIGEDEIKDWEKSIEIIEEFWENLNTGGSSFIDEEKKYKIPNYLLKNKHIKHELLIKRLDEERIIDNNVQIEKTDESLNDW